MAGAQPIRPAPNFPLVAAGLPFPARMGELVARLEMLPAAPGMMGLVPIHALRVELRVLVAQVLVQLRLGTEPQFALWTVQHVHGLILLLRHRPGESFLSESGDG